MSQNGSGIAASNTTSEHFPWCLIDHADPMFDSDCHIGEVDWSSDLGLTLGTADGAPVTVDILWNHAAHAEDVRWTPDEARAAAAELLRLADIAEYSSLSEAERTEKDQQAAERKARVARILEASRKAAGGAA